MNQKHTGMPMATIIQTPERGRLFLSLATTAFFLFGPSPLSAQEDNATLLIQLMDRMGKIEAENRELRGQLEETQHELSALNKQVETLNADIDYRLNNPESGSMPLPLPPSQVPVEEDKKPSLPNSDADQEYEEARTLLEQGDYDAAERAFAAFVASHPKHKQAGAAQYWLGVTHFVRGEHEKAVAAFAKGYKNYAKSPKAADNLLKLAKSLSTLDRKADACTTLEQLSSEYPKFQVKEVASERRKLNCK
jgi:tol-pal system protein YbgF